VTRTQSAQWRRVISDPSRLEEVAKNRWLRGTERRASATGRSGPTSHLSVHMSAPQLDPVVDPRLGELPSRAGRLGVLPCPFDCGSGRAEHRQGAARKSGRRGSAHSAPAAALRGIQLSTVRTRAIAREQQNSVRNDHSTHARKFQSGPVFT
jgi:hypothetical protein